MWSWKVHLPRPHSCECGRGRLLTLPRPQYSNCGRGRVSTYKSVVVESGKISGAISLFISLQHFLSSSTLHSLSLFTRRRLLPSRELFPQLSALSFRRLLPFFPPSSSSPHSAAAFPFTLGPLHSAASLFTPPPPSPSLCLRLPLHSRPLPPLLLSHSATAHFR